MKNALLILACLSSLIIPPLSPVSAQDSIQAELHTFAEFRNEAIRLQGPADSQPIKFNLPAHWQLTDDVLLQLQMTVFLPISGTESPSRFQGTVGSLKLTVNGNMVDEILLQRSGDAVENLTIPSESIPVDGYMDLQLLLETYLPCQSGESSIQIRIHPTSTFQLSYQTREPDTNLTRFPRQLFQDSIFPDRALLVIPDQPTITELQSMLTVAAGMSRLSGNELQLEMVSVSEVTPEMQANSHLILVGKPEPFLALDGLKFPSPIVVRSDPERTVQFLLPDRYEFERTAPDDGIIQLVISSWNPNRLILMVSGETDTGVLKAARAVSSGKLRSNVFPNLAIIKETYFHPQRAWAWSQSLAELGYSSQQLNDASATAFDFYLPPNAAVGQGSAIEIDYARSTSFDMSMGIWLNDQPLGSLPLDVPSGGENRATFVLPAGILQPGKNRLEIRADHSTPDFCIQDSAWMTISSASRLNLLPGSANDDISAPLSLHHFPAALISESTLASIAFALPREDASAWLAAMQIAGQVGAAANGDVVELAAFFGDELPEDALSSYHILAVGRASTLPFIADLNDGPPVVFEKGKDIPAETGMDITYRISKDYDSAGYLEIFPLPKNGEYVILAVLGSDAQGIAWAASALTTPTMRNQLIGDFALVNGRQIFAGVMRSNPAAAPSQTPSQSPSQSPTIIPEEAPEVSCTVVNSSAVWQAGIVILALIVLLLSIQFRRRQR